MSDNDQNEQQEEQEQLAREIGDELTDAFVAYVRGGVTFDDLTFGVFDALSDLHTIASGEYELADDEDEEHDHDHDHEKEPLEYDEEEAVEEQEDLAQEPGRR